MNEWLVESSHWSPMKGRGLNPPTDIPTIGSKRVEFSWIEYTVMRAKLLATLLPRPAKFVLDGNSRPTVNSDQLS